MDRASSLEPFFHPKSIAVVGVTGAADGVTSAGHRFLGRLLQYEYKGKIYPIHPKGGEAMGLPVYVNLQAVPGPVDCVISCLGASRVTELMKDCVAKGVKAVVLFTAGFSETGRPEARELESEVVRTARAAGIRIIGPNCMGVCCPEAGLAFGADFPRESGPVGLICQSGTNALFSVRAAAERGVRFSKVVSYGNASDVDECDLLEYLADDPQTGIIAAYIEGVKDGHRLARVIRRVAASKPVIILKAGMNQDGARATSSHTGSLAGSSAVWDAMLWQSGAIAVRSLDELVDMTVTLSYMRAPQGKRVGIFGVGGGVSVLATDECSAAGFAVPPLPPDLRRSLLEAAGTDAGTMLDNPIDFPFWVAGDEKYREVVKRLLAWDGIDMFLVLGPLRHTELPLEVYKDFLDWQLDRIIAVGRDSSKPIAVVMCYLATGESWMAAAHFQRKCYEAGLPVYFSVTSAVKAVDRLLAYQQRR